MPQSEVWIAYRGDGLGDGTVGNPYDGGTLARFDAAMRGLSANTSVHLAPSASPFETNGYYDGIGENVGWRAKPGMRIIGSGVEATVLRLDGALAARLGAALALREERALTAELHPRRVLNPALRCPPCPQPRTCRCLLVAWTFFGVWILNFGF